MQQANQIIEDVVRQPSEQKPLDNLNSQVMEDLWDTMLETYELKWEDKFGLEPTTVWINAMSRLSIEMIEMGFQRLSRDKRFLTWPPGPLEFRALCLPRGEDLGLPSFEAAFGQATGRNTWKHPAVAYAIRLLVDQFAFRQAKAEKAEAMFQEVWGKTLEFVINGGKLPEKEKEIEEVSVKADPKSDKVMESRRALGLPV